MPISGWKVWLGAGLLATAQLGAGYAVDPNSKRSLDLASNAPRLALKLTPEGLKKQLEDPEFIASLVTDVETLINGLNTGRHRRRLVSTVAPLVPEDHRPSAALRKRLDLSGIEIPSFAEWFQIDIDDIGLSAISTASSDTGKGSPLALSGFTLELIHKLNDLEVVSSVHALQQGPPPAVNPNDDPRSGNQGYLNAAPQGINARYAWTVTGGDGANVGVVDMEQGWNLNHEDLRAANITLISGRNGNYFDHGTAVLGQMLMTDNQIGGVGIIPAAKGRVISQSRPDGSYNTASTILDACNNMAVGDILLLEAQEFDPVGGQYYWPVSVADANFDAILVCSGKGIVVVEAACNGGFDLDAYRNLAGKRIFNRAVSNEYRESGAIMVGASSQAVPHVRLGYSNHGSRVDVHGWGENIDTTFTNGDGTANNLYTTGFSGTSGASPIIVGAAAAVQGIAQARLGRKLSPARVRTILTTSGTASSNPSSDRIGVLPNLKAIIDGGHIRV
ncbi:peptidase S8/S53 domain-containing protein [Triangularia verruculosa]|uniref:Peptidase S8/S53 domain-containing protein n=1 Tax=Triangularia verruculosa TaxID=2587418 RepID=A0AAN7AQ00_9PEZI|nr:peptidase S8/S53 domain-containing protein [Triangularia verruculosa]